MRKFTAAALALLFVSTATGGGLPGSEIDDLWFKVKLKTKGYAYDGPLADAEKATFSATFFLNLDLVEMVDVANVIYTVTTWSETAPDVWEAVDSDSEFFEPETGPDIYLFRFMDPNVTLPDGSVMQCDSVLALRPSKVGETGDVEKAKLESLAMTATGTLADGSLFTGGGTLKGKSVDIEDLPFSPN